MSGGAGLAEIEGLYRSRFADFLRVSTAITGSLESGRDAVHEAMVSSVRSRKTYRGEGTVEAWLWRAIRALPERQRLVLFLRYYADLDYGAIAVVLGIRPGTVGAALNAAHDALRGRIREVTNT